MKKLKKLANRTKNIWSLFVIAFLFFAIALNSLTVSYESTIFLICFSILGVLFIITQVSTLNLITYILEKYEKNYTKI